jgi:hypothetical protein
MQSNGKKIESKKFPISNQQNSKICDLSFQISFHLYKSLPPYTYLHLTIKSTPVSEPIFFEADFAIWNAEMTLKSQKVQFSVKEYQIGQEIHSSTSLNLVAGSWRDIKKNLKFYFSNN